MSNLKHVKIIAGAVPGTQDIVTKFLEHPIGWQTLRAAGIDLVAADTLPPQEAHKVAARLDKWLESQQSQRR